MYDACNEATFGLGFVLNSAQYILHFASGHPKTQLGAACKVKS
jgi:hypothetical protein